MATLTKDTPREYESAADIWCNHIPVIASDIIYQGAAVGESGTSGTARPLEGGDNFLGFATQQADNSTGSASDINVKVRQKGTVKLKVTGASGVTDLGDEVYAADDNDFTLTASGATQIGKVVRWISSTTCMVYFEGLQARSV
jgi:hypothetical protein